MEHKTRCSNVQYLIDYFMNLGIAESQLLKGVKAEKSFIANPHDWLAIEDFHQIMNNCQESCPHLTLDDWQKIALSIKDNEVTGIWKTIVRFIGIKTLYSLTPRYAKSFNTYIDLKINSITKNSVDCLIISDPNVCSYFMIRWSVGVLQSVPCALGLPPAKASIVFDQCDLESVVTGLYKKYDIAYKDENGIIYADEKLLGQYIQLNQKIENGRTVFTNDFSYEKPYNAILIIDDLIKNDTYLLKKGEIFNAPYGRVFLTWAVDKNRFSFHNSQKLKEELLISYNEQLTLAEERYFESDRLRKKEQDKNIQFKKALDDFQKTKNALQVYWEKRDEDRRKIEKEIILNMKKVVEPSITKLKNSNLNVTQQKLVDQLEQKINNVLLPLSYQMKFKDYNFTSSEIQIAKLIQDGKRSKEICELLNISLRTVETHRMNIRKKLNISNKDINLSSYLISIK
ncbi:MAG: LuxR C-terminal-related transcriptional regulator [Desulfobacterales bacterium]|nr:LuxR C-terminal-related transcriptional regulator [Desulfobacterales bacterium]